MRVKLKELGEVITGNTPSKMILDYWDSDDISFVKPDIISDSGITTIVESSEYLSEKAREKARIVSENAIFVTCIGSIGKIGIAGPGYYAFNQQINVIVPNENVVPKYLAYAMLHSKPQLTAIANAPVVPIINKSQFSDFEINIDTDMQKQVEIVNVLDKVVGIIQARENELSKLDDLVKARFVEMFGDPVTNEKNWPRLTLGDICEIGSSKRVFEKEYVPNGVPFFRTKEIVELSKGNQISTELFISKEHFEKLKKSYGVPKKDDLLISAVGTIGTIWIVNGDFEFYFKDGNLIHIKASPNFSSIFMKYLLNELIANYKKEMSTGTAYSALTIAGLKKMLVYDVPLVKQNQFATLVKQVDKSKDAVQKSLDKLQILFDKLMQEYFG